MKKKFFPINNIQFENDLLEKAHATLASLIADFEQMGYAIGLEIVWDVKYKTSPVRPTVDYDMYLMAKITPKNSTESTQILDGTVFIGSVLFRKKQPCFEGEIPSKSLKVTELLAFMQEYRQEISEDGYVQTFLKEERETNEQAKLFKMIRCVARIIISAGCLSVVYMLIKLLRTIWS
jgi:hypothetical protein